MSKTENAATAVTSAGTQATRASFPFLAILSLIFVVAKIVGYFPYSWWIVFLPMYAIPVSFIASVLTVLILGGIVFGLLFIFAAIADVVKNRGSNSVG